MTEAFSTSPECLAAQRRDLEPYESGIRDDLVGKRTARAELGCRTAGQVLWTKRVLLAAAAAIIAKVRRVRWALEIDQGALARAASDVLPPPLGIRFARAIDLAATDVAARQALALVTAIARREALARTTLHAEIETA